MDCAPLDLGIQMAVTSCVSPPASDARAFSAIRVAPVSNLTGRLRSASFPRLATMARIWTSRFGATGAGHTSKLNNRGIDIPRRFDDDEQRFVARGQTPIVLNLQTNSVFAGAELTRVDLSRWLLLDGLAVEGPVPGADATVGIG